MSSQISFSTIEPQRREPFISNLYLEFSVPRYFLLLFAFCNALHVRHAAFRGITCHTLIVRVQVRICGCPLCIWNVDLDETL